MVGFRTGSLGLIKFHSGVYRKGEIFILALTCGLESVYFGSVHVDSVSLEQGCPTSCTTSTRNLSKPLVQLLLWSPERMLCWEIHQQCCFLKLKKKKIKFTEVILKPGRIRVYLSKFYAPTVSLWSLKAAIANCGASSMWQQRLERNSWKKPDQAVELGMTGSFPQLSKFSGAE